MSDWKFVAEEKPPRDAMVLVWFQGRHAFGRYAPEFPLPGLHEWLVYRSDGCPVAPYPQYQPKWWAHLPETPKGEVAAKVSRPGADPAPSLAHGEPTVRWRGSLSDLVTDLRGALGLVDWQRLLRELDRNPAPVPMLIYCPECGGRHVDEGEFAIKPHHTHACQHCGHAWRPAVCNTVGVQFLPGFKNAGGSGLEARDSEDREP